MPTQKYISVVGFSWNPSVSVPNIWKGLIPGSILVLFISKMGPVLGFSF
jgi:hypothetical protein